MALKAGYVGVKRWLYEKLQKTTAENVQGIADLWTNNTVMGAKNLLPISFDNIKSINTSGTWDGTSYTRNDIVYTCTVVNGYVTKITANGTASADAAMLLIKDNTNKYSGNILSGCPENGSTSTYYVGVEKTSSPYTGYGSDTGSGAKINSYSSNEVMIFIRIKSGVVASDLEFEPMIRVAADPDENFAPYAMTNQQLTKSIIKTTGTFDQVTANKSGYMVELSFTGTTITNEDGKTLGTLDAAYRPSGNINLYTKVYNGSSYVDAQVKVTASTGAVELLTLSGNAVTGAQVNFLLARPVFMSGSAAGLTRGVSDTREASPEVIADDPEPVTKTTRKSTKKEDN